MAILYRHIRLDKNEPFYIGIGTDEKRMDSRKSRNVYWKNITQKTDWFSEVVLDDLTWEEACEKEKEFIALYGRKDLGTGILCNMTDGGDGFLSLSDECKNRQKENTKKAWLGRKHTDESKEKIRNASILQFQKMEGTMKGKKHSIETREKITKSLIGSRRNVKIIVDLETGIFYDSIKDLSKSINMHYKTFHNHLKLGKYKNKYELI
jgi:hypothetical protein